MRPILVTGRDGQLARSLMERAAARGTTLVARGRPELDLTDPASVEKTVAAVSPSIIINAAAYTAVDKAESEPDLAFAVNRDGAQNVAAAASRLGVPIVHISTDYVFNGSKQGSWHEDDATAPMGIYGASKRAGEEAVLATNTRSVVLRTAWVYSPFGANFVKTMLRVAAAGKPLRVVNDQHGNPTSALDLADVVLAIADRMALDGEAGCRGIFHAAGADSTTWYGFARDIFALSAARGGPTAEVTPIPTSEYPTPARRPLNSVLATERLARLYGQRLPGFSTSLAPVVSRLVDEMRGQRTL